MPLPKRREPIKQFEVVQCAKNLIHEPNEVVIRLQKKNFFGRYTTIDSRSISLEHLNQYMSGPVQIFELPEPYDVSILSELSHWHQITVSFYKQDKMVSMDTFRLSDILRNPDIHLRNSYLDHLNPL